MLWVNRFIGVPFKEKGRDYDGVDCYGPVFLAFRDLLGITLPDYLDGYRSTADIEDISNLINGERKNGDWVTVDPSEKPKEFDVVLIRLNARYMHVGLCLGDGRFMHCLAGSMITVEKLDAIIWKHRIQGFYRHVSLC